MKKSLLLCLIMAAVVCGCKKYEDGPLISFRSAKSRLLGHHTLTKFTVDGNDSLQAFKNRLGENFYFFKNYSTGHYNLQIDNDSTVYLMRFDFKDKNTEIVINNGLGMLTGNYTGYLEAELNIIKLKNDDIKLRSDYGGVEYIIELQ